MWPTGGRGAPRMEDSGSVCTGVAAWRGNCLASRGRTAGSQLPGEGSEARILPQLPSAHADKIRSSKRKVIWGHWHQTAWHVSLTAHQGSGVLTGRPTPMGTMATARGTPSTPQVYTTASLHEGRAGGARLQPTHHELDGQRRTDTQGEGAGARRTAPD